MIEFENPHKTFRRAEMEKELKLCGEPISGYAMTCAETLARKIRQIKTMRVYDNTVIPTNGKVLLCLDSIEGDSARIVVSEYDIDVHADSTASGEPLAKFDLFRVSWLRGRSVTESIIHVSNLVLDLFRGLHVAEKVYYDDGNGIKTDLI